MEIFRQYLWVDEKGKKSRLSAPQYIDYIMTYVQKTINDESTFPTKHGKYLVFWVKVLIQIEILFLTFQEMIFHQAFLTHTLRRYINCFFMFWLTFTIAISKRSCCCNCMLIWMLSLFISLNSILGFIQSTKKSLRYWYFFIFSSLTNTN